jgi:ELWxxDGT repeat protein
MFSYNGSVYFAGYDVTNLQQLWVSDGTSSGTQLFKVLNSTANSFPTVFNIINNKMIFLAENQPSNSELWVSDGTASGTTLLSDINSNPNLSSNPQNFYAIGNKMYFSADDGVHGNELWVTDGTTLGTNLKFDINVGVNSSNPNALFYDGTQLFMGADSLINDLMVTDLVITPKTYCKVNNGISSSPSEIFKINSKLFVVATGAYGNEIYSIDTVNTVGINEISKNIQLNVYPNPTNSFINIDKALIGHDYVLTNYIGEIILSGEVKETINLEELISGVYYLKIEGGIAKIIKY